MIGEQINSEFPSGDIDMFLDEFQTPKQDMHIDEFEDMDELTPPEPEAEPEPEPNEPLPDLQMRAGVARSSGKLIATVIDTTLPAALAMIANEDTTPYKAVEEDREELEKALSEYLKLKGGDIPPGMMVLVLVLSIYGSKIPIALQHRKLNKEREALEAKARQLDAREKALLVKEKETEETKGDE